MLREAEESGASPASLCPDEPAEPDGLTGDGGLESRRASAPQTCSPSRAKLEDAEVAGARTRQPGGARFADAVRDAATIARIDAECRWTKRRPEASVPAPLPVGDSGSPNGGAAPPGGSGLRESPARPTESSVIGGCGMSMGGCSPLDGLVERCREGDSKPSVIPACRHEAPRGEPPSSALVELERWRPGDMSTEASRSARRADEGWAREGDTGASSPSSPISGGGSRRKRWLVRMTATAMGSTPTTRAISRSPKTLQNTTETAFERAVLADVSVSQDDTLLCLAGRTTMPEEGT